MLNPYTIKVQQKICSKKTETFLETHALGKLFLVEFKPFRKKFFFKIKLEIFIQKMIWVFKPLEFFKNLKTVT